MNRLMKHGNEVFIRDKIRINPANIYPPPPHPKNFQTRSGISTRGLRIAYAKFRKKPFMASTTMASLKKGNSGEKTEKYHA